MNRNHLHQIQVRVPNVATQREISAALGALDDTIDLNGRTNETLESMARVIFKSWFIDFDPVRAKAEGRKPAGMDADTAALFPDEFADFDGAGIPSGWLLAPLASIAEIVMGASPDGETYNSLGVGTPLINGPVEFGPVHPVRTKWTTTPTRLSKAGDLILCVRGSTTGRSVIADGEYCLGRGVCAIRSLSGANGFIVQTVRSNLERLLAFTVGSVFPNLSSRDITSFAVVSPRHEITHAFSRLAAPLFARIGLNVVQSAALTALRDALLPKLLSGAIRIRDAEKQVEAVV